MVRHKRNEGYMSRREFIGLAGAATGTLLLGACVPVTPAPAPEAAPSEAVPSREARRGGTLRIAFPGTSGQLDPALYTTQEDYMIGFALYNGLVWVDQTLTPQPDLAESWTPSGDLLTWTFKLKEGIKFQHGTPFTADDVVYTFERIMDEALGSPFRSVIGFVEGVEKTDDYTVNIQLKTPSADLHTLLGQAQARIVPHDRTTEQLSEEPLGTGPFVLKEYVPGDHTTLVRKEDYWEEGIPYLDEVRHVYMPEEATQIAALTGGSIDIMQQVGFENITTVDQHPDTTVAEARSGQYQDIVMRVTEEPFTDNRVRMALKYCVDRSGVRQVVLQGLGDLGNDHPIPPISPVYADLPIREQNHGKAKELLAEAGYPDGLDITLITSPVRPGLVEYAVAFQEMAKPAGVNVEIERVPADQYWSEYWMKVPLCMSNWTLRATADETLTTAYHSEAKWNESDFRSPELDRLIEDARGEQDQDKRKELYGEAQKLLSDEGGVIISYFKPVVQGVRNEVQNFHPHPTAWIRVNDVWLSESA
jgi:peptide/nickel transport system substrate-binding protein